MVNIRLETHVDLHRPGIQQRICGPGGGAIKRLVEEDGGVDGGVPCVLGPESRRLNVVA
jgi:hypothetical protein